MLAYTPIDYAQAYFPEPVLPKIVGIPTFDKLKSMKKSLKSNAASVQSDLGGGAHGHLGLVLDDEAYHAATGEHYVAPNHPGALVIQAGTALHEAVRLREEHAEHIRVFRESIDVKTALMKQITSTIDNDYLKELRDEVTNTITMSIPDVLAFLFRRYGKVDSNKVSNEETKVKEFSWNIVDPPVCIFNLIEDLKSVANAAGVPKTEAQLINYGLDIVRNTGEFENGLIAWEALIPANKTWSTFKNHFTDAHTALIKVRGNSMRGSSFYQANATIEALSTEMTAIRNDLMNSINSLAIGQEETFCNETASTVNNSSSLSTSTGNQTNDALLAAIQSLQNQISSLCVINGNEITRAPNNRQRQPFRPRRNTSKYCWSHGACAHDSSECQAKKPGHIDSATFENKRGGSTAYCGNST